jgi:hypothetical protein
MQPALDSLLKLTSSLGVLRVAGSGDAAAQQQELTTTSASTIETEGSRQQSHELRVRRFCEALLAERIDLPAVRRLAVHGIPERAGLRPLVWKVRAQYCSHLAV